MQLTNVLAAFLLVGTAFAAPSADKPKKPEKPTYSIVQQANQCGNNVTPYCCNADNKSSSSCKAIDNSDQCNTVIICCNANDSKQKCFGSA
ncbi:hypothetical protein MMC29_001272 [Sticta canariensis]|nr:hypothetical protein [Sticta canariensis]